MNGFSQRRYFKMQQWRLISGDCLVSLKDLGDATVDSVVTDPPAGIGFSHWDNFDAPGLMTMVSNEERKGSHAGATGHAHSHGLQGILRTQGSLKARKNFIDFLTPVMSECFRVLKPGGHALVWALPRTSHWTATAIEDAGFEIRDSIAAIFSQGFSKSLNIGLAIDKLARSLPEKLEAQKWSGFGTALKPAMEIWWLARRPLVGTAVENVLAHGTGGLNIDTCRVGVKSGGSPDGRLPANVVLSHAEGCRNVGTKKVKGKEVEAFECVEGCPVAALDKQTGLLQSGVMKAGQQRKKSKGLGGYNDSFPDTANMVETYGDSGGGSRFFNTFSFESDELEVPFYYCAKAPPRERYFYCTLCVAAFPNLVRDEHKHDQANWSHLVLHPTVKNIRLMEFLCRLVTPPGGLILDPFLGTGSTGVAAMKEGFKFIGIDKDPIYIEIAKKRLTDVCPLTVSKPELVSRVNGNGTSNGHGNKPSLVSRQEYDRQPGEPNEPKTDLPKLQARI